MGLRLSAKSSAPNLNSKSLPACVILHLYRCQVKAPNVEIELKHSIHKKIESTIFRILHEFNFYLLNIGTKLCKNIGMEELYIINQKVTS